MRGKMQGGKQGTGKISYFNLRFKYILFLLRIYQLLLKRDANLPREIL